ncbi:tRNA (guanine(46)-N(7))-methyltransferase [hydrothermal vent metagenome]|uniref:tRNA (guanine(46)-N(7))-methyltransferase n=1 Tax=hydrothermal vent metagenome TaxID=652676 RepID=A0A3B1A7J2_9ZZZZ
MPCASYILNLGREGRLTSSQARAMRELYPKFGIEFQTQQLDVNAEFARAADTFIDIGFGTGTSVVHMAALHPEHNHLGVEVHRPGVGNLLLQVEKNNFSNVRVICYDVMDVLNNMIADESLTGVFLFFPDPWHKRKHHKRRLVQETFIQLLRKKLQVGGFFHMATDWKHYAQQMMTEMNVAEGFVNKAGDNNYCERPDYRPITKFEQRGFRLGHSVWDLIFIKNN